LFSTSIKDEPSTPPKVPTNFAYSIDAITGLDNYSQPPRHDLHITYPQKSHVSHHAALDCSPDTQTLAVGDIAGAYGYNQLWQRGLHGVHMTMNLVEVDGSYQNDIQNYLGCINFKGHLSFVNIDGHPSDAQGESTLDIQMAAGLAPQLLLLCIKLMATPTAIPGFRSTMNCNVSLM
jgi:kumamolisin